MVSTKKRELYDLFVCEWETLKELQTLCSGLYLKLVVLGCDGGRGSSGGGGSGGGGGGGGAGTSKARPERGISVGSFRVCLYLLVNEPGRTHTDTQIKTHIRTITHARTHARTHAP